MTAASRWVAASRNSQPLRQIEPKQSRRKWPKIVRHVKLRVCISMVRLELSASV
jgi:hypothetical protein